MQFECVNCSVQLVYTRSVFRSIRFAGNHIICLDTCERVFACSDVCRVLYICSLYARLCVCLRIMMVCSHNNRVNDAQHTAAHMHVVLNMQSVRLFAPSRLSHMLTLPQAQTHTYSEYSHIQWRCTELRSVRMQSVATVSITVSLRSSVCICVQSKCD